MTPPVDSEPDRQDPVPRPPFRWGTRVLLPAALALAFTLILIASVGRSLAPATEVAVLPVVQRAAILRVAPAEVAGVDTAVVQAAGWIEPDPFLTYAATLTNGTVQEVLFLEGDTVQRGQVLVRLIPDDARLALERAKAELQAAEETWEENVDATAEATAASAAVLETRAAHSQATALLEQERALHEDAESMLRRAEKLLKEDVGTQQRNETLRADAVAKAAGVRAARSRIVELEAMLARRRSDEAAAKKHLELRTEDRRRLENARIGLAEAELRMNRMEIKAPIDGVIMHRMVQPGSMLMASSDNAEMAKVATLYDPAHLQVRVDVPLADAAKVGRGQRALLTVEVLPDMTFEGTVTRVTSHADIQKNTLEVKVAVDEPSELLKPDMLTRVRFLSPEKTNSEVTTTGLSVFAPAAAITNGEVWIVSGYDGTHGEAVKRVVETTGAEDDGWVEIESGLNAGDLLIAPGGAPMEAGQRVTLRHDERNTDGQD